MTRQPGRIYVILDKSFGEKIGLLPPGMPIWIVESPENKSYMGYLWREDPQGSLIININTFQVTQHTTSEENLINELETIDIDLRSRALEMNFSEIEVIGVHQSDEVMTLMNKLGYSQFEDTQFGFIARR